MTIATDRVHHRYHKPGPWVDADAILPYRGQTVKVLAVNAERSLLAYHDGDTWRDHHTGLRMADIIGWRWIQ